METKEIYSKIMIELGHAKHKWPNCYKDIIHAVALVNEEAGEAIQATLDLTYDNGSIENVKSELIQTGAMVFRALENIDKLEAMPCLIWE